MFLFLLSTDPKIKPPSETIDETVYTDLGNDSIKVVTKNLTWAQAQELCKGDGANLASLRNDWTRAYVELVAIKLNTPFWIGLNKDQVQGCNYLKFTLDSMKRNKQTGQLKLDL